MYQPHSLVALTMQHPFLVAGQFLDLPFPEKVILTADPPPALILFKASTQIDYTPARETTYSPCSASIIVPPWECLRPPTRPPVAYF